MGAGDRSACGRQDGCGEIAIFKSQATKTKSFPYHTDLLQQFISNSVDVSRGGIAVAVSLEFFWQPGKFEQAIFSHFMLAGKVYLIVGKFGMI